MPENIVPHYIATTPSPEEPKVIAAREKIRGIATRWLAAFNEKNINNLLDLYAPDAAYHNPMLLEVHPETGGTIRGREEMRKSWGEVFKKMPKLSYLVMGIETGSGEALVTYMRKMDDKSTTREVRELLKIKDGKIIESTVLAA